MVAGVRKVAGNVVLIEGGDMVGRPTVEQDRLKADVAIKCLNKIGYNAVVPGESEIFFGRKALEGWQAACKAPFVLANAAEGQDKPAFRKPYTVYKTPGGVRVGIIGLLSPKLMPALLDRQLEVQLTDPTATLKRLGPRVRREADFVIVVAHTKEDEARALAKLGSADVVLCTHSDDKVVMPEKGSNTNEVDVAGEKIGRTIFVKSGVLRGWSVGRLDVEIENGKAASFRNRLFYLDRTYDEDLEIVKLFVDYNERVKQMSLSQDQKMRAQFDEIMRKRGFDPAKRQRPKVFAGAAACKDCHSAAYEVWSKTRHARAFASLEKTKQEFDPECISCHTTGVMQRGGFTNAKDTPELANVQCEACHGPGAGHAAKPETGYGQVEEDLCRGCHTDAYNPDFDYGEMWKAIAHDGQ